MTASEVPAGTPPPSGPATLRLDKWLWHARFFKTRSLATKVCRAGKVRINGERVSKASATVGIGDVLTFPQGHTIRIARVLAFGERRGPAEEARTLYEDLTPPKPEDDPSGEKRPRGGGRPTKRDRRAIDRLKGDSS